MTLFYDIALIVGAYLLGAVPHLNAVAKLRGVRISGDLHQGLFRQAGLPAAAAGVLGDFVKGSLPVILGYLLDFNLAVVAAAGLAAVCGQMWPAWTKFQGEERGNTVGLAVLTALGTWAMAIAIIPLTGGLIFRTVPRMLIKKSPASTGEVFGGRFSNSLPLGMIGCFLVFPLASWYLRQPSEIIAAGWAFLMLVLVRRLTAGVRRDLKTSIAKKRIFFNRLLYDRPTQRHPPDGASAR